MQRNSQRTPEISLQLISFWVSLLLLGLVTTCPAQEFDQLLDELQLSESKAEPKAETNNQSNSDLITDIHGVVVTQKKYSVTVQAGSEQYEIKLPTTVSIERELIRPRFDFEKSVVRMTLPCTSKNGNQTENQKVQLELPDPLFLQARFRNTEEKQTFLDGGSQQVAEYSLLPQLPKVDGPLQVSGAVRVAGQALSLATSEKVFPIKLGNRANSLGGYSILDLKGGTEVSVRALKSDGGWIAQHVTFQQTETQPTESTNSQPRLLSLGDMVSFSYQRALHEQLADQYRVVHPPTTCGGSANWPMLNRWLGDYTGRRWDVIVFNTGMHDNQLTKEKYQQNLKRWIEAIEPAGDQIVWLTTTPIQKPATGTVEGELVGKVPGRMKLQNEWAAEVLAEYPKIKVCDLWKVVHDGKDSEFKAWWEGTRPQFNYRQSKVIAAAIAEAMNAQQLAPDN